MLLNGTTKPFLLVVVGVFVGSSQPALLMQKTFYATTIAPQREACNDIDRHDRESELLSLSPLLDHSLLYLVYFELTPVVRLKHYILRTALLDSPRKGGGMVNGVNLKTIFVCLALVSSVFSTSHHDTLWCENALLNDHFFKPGYETPILTIGAPKYENHKAQGSQRISGLGNNFDLLYTVPIKLSDMTFPVNLDTGSSDLWLISDICHGDACEGIKVPRYPSLSVNSTNRKVHMHYGDSNSGTFASGIVAIEEATLAGITMDHHPFGLINDTTNLLGQFGASGILGLSFPSASSIQATLMDVQMDFGVDTDKFVSSVECNGPLLSRIASKSIGMSMFSISLQKHPNVFDGQGTLTVGKLPDGVDNSSLTWVPVRLYTEEDGGMSAPRFAPNEVYPYRWEIDIDGVFLDGQKLPDSTIPAKSGETGRVSALIDSGNSLIRGPEDVVIKILQDISPGFDPEAVGSIPSVPCAIPQTLAFQIGGQMFPIDPRDFISQLNPDNASICQADNIVPTDVPDYGHLFRWSLGTPFFRSNIVAFYYGNLTHPSVDPPRIGLRSIVPTNVNLLLREAVSIAAMTNDASSVLGLGV